MTKLHDYPRGDGSEVPRPFEKWLTAVFRERSWRNTIPRTPWYRQLKALADKWQCALRIDLRWHWSESCYCHEFGKQGPHLLVGGRGSDAEVCTAALHELGHHILHATHQVRSDRVKDEEAAWGIARRLAGEHRLPFAPNLPRVAMHSYRMGRQRRLESGSRRRTRRPKRTTIDRIQGSARTSEAGRVIQCRPVGKKGKRRFKKDTKRRTARTERRQDFEV